MVVLPGLIHFASHSPKLCLRGGVGVHALRLAVHVYMHIHALKLAVLVYMHLD